MIVDQDVRRRRVEARRQLRSTGHPGRSVPFGRKTCTRPSHPAWTISRVPSPFMSTSTGDAVAPWWGARVKGSSGRGIAGVDTPVSSVWGQPGPSVPKSVPDVGACRSLEVAAVQEPAVVIQVADRTPVTTGSWPGLTPGVLLGHLRRVGVTGKPGSSSASGRCAWTWPSVSPKMIALPGALKVCEHRLRLAALAPDLLREAVRLGRVVGDRDRPALLADPALASMT